jgi:hypothetical protein
MHGEYNVKFCSNEITSILPPPPKSAQNSHFLYPAFNIYIFGVDKLSYHPPGLDNCRPPMIISEVTCQMYS